MHWEVYASRLCGFLFLQLAACISLWLISLSDKISILFRPPPFLFAPAETFFFEEKKCFLGSQPKVGSDSHVNN